MDAENHRRLLGEVLVQEGLLTEEQLAVALAEQQRTGERLGAILVASGLLSGATVAMALADQHGSALRTEHGWATGWAAARQATGETHDAPEPPPVPGAPNPPSRAGTPVLPLPRAAGAVVELRTHAGAADAPPPDAPPASAPELDALARAVDAKRQELEALTTELGRAKAEWDAVREANPVNEPDQNDFVVVAVVDGRYVVQLGRGTPPPVGATLRLPGAPNLTFLVARDRWRHCLYVDQLNAHGS